MYLQNANLLIILSGFYTVRTKFLNSTYLCTCVRTCAVDAVGMGAMSRLFRTPCCAIRWRRAVQSHLSLPVTFHMSCCSTPEKDCLNEIIRVDWMSWQSCVCRYGFESGKMCEWMSERMKEQMKTLWYSTVHYSTLQCSTVQYSTVHYITLQFST